MARAEHRDLAQAGERRQLGVQCGRRRRIQREFLADGKRRGVMSCAEHEKSVAVHRGIVCAGGGGCRLAFTRSSESSAATNRTTHVHAKRFPSSPPRIRNPKPSRYATQTPIVMSSFDTLTLLKRS